jgi:hypothetical protein
VVTDFDMGQALGGNHNRRKQKEKGAIDLVTDSLAGYRGKFLEAVGRCLLS